MTTDWLRQWKVYLHPQVLTLLALGFSSGLPLLLVLGTLSFWLREAGIDRSTITYFSWAGLAWGFKWAWAPLIDRLPLPFLNRSLGRRRSWLLVSQLAIAASLAALALSEPTENLQQMALFAVAVAFFSATQDIVVDAYRIECAENRLQGAMAAAYMAGYRLAMLVAGAGSLTIAALTDSDEASYQSAPWMISYLSMSALMGVGILTTLLSKEPDSVPPLPYSATATSKAEKIALWFKTAVINPFAEFIQRYGGRALLVLALIGTYRISDILLGVVANIFYADLGFTKLEVAEVTKVFGVIMTLLGAFLGGVLVNRFGTLKVLLAGAILAAGSNLLFSLLAVIGNSVPMLMVVISIDNLSAGIATAAFVAYLSSLTNIQYSATQYALFSSIMLLLPKFMGGFSGQVVDAVDYPLFFMGTALIGIPVIILIVLAMRYLPVEETAEERKQQEL